jgi:hypothetical protein
VVLGQTVSHVLDRLAKCWFFSLVLPLLLIFLSQCFGSLPRIVPRIRRSVVTT